ncbi:MAG: hypothetical protein O7G85_16845 [Planctomycetota bacterium]|nr:hypothetical protein [Planctomycetota bacterium]
MRQPLFVVLFILVGVTASVHGQERFLFSSPLVYPDPVPGRFRLSQHVAGPWLLWIDATSNSAVNPTYEMKIFRGRDGAEPELLTEARGTGGSIGIKLTDSGLALICLHGTATLYPVDGEPYQPTALNEGVFLVKPVHFDNDTLVATRNHHRLGNGMKDLLQFDLSSDTPLKAITAVSWAPRPHNFVFDDGNMAWLQRSTKVLEPLLYVALQDQSTRQIPLTCALTLTLDGLYDNWLLLHEGDLVRLLDLETDRELQIRMPGQVEFVHPRGIFWRADRHRSKANYTRLVWWDVATGTRRIILVPRLPKHFPLLHRLEADRLVLLNRREFSVVELDEEPKPLGKEDMEDAAERLKFVCQFPLQTATMSQNLHWPRAAETIEFLAELVATHEDPNAARQAWYLLGESSDPAARRILLEQLQRTDGWHDWRSIAGVLRRFGTPEDAMTIIACEPPAGVVEEVAETLGILGNAKCIPWLESKRELHIRNRRQAERTAASIKRALRLIKDREEAIDVLIRLREP